MENEIKVEIDWFEKNLSDSQVHGRNILAKLKDFSNLPNGKLRQLKAIISEYRAWVSNNINEKGYGNDTIRKRTEWLNILPREI
jgi:hypothetical protein